MTHSRPRKPRPKPWLPLLAASALLATACGDSRSLTSPASYCPQVIRPSREAADWLVETPKPASVLDWLDKVTRQQMVFANGCR